MLGRIVSRSFGSRAQNALHIIAPRKSAKESIKRWSGFEVPIWEEVGPKFEKTKPKTFSQFDDSLPQNHLSIKVTYSENEPEVVRKARLAVPPLILTPLEKPPVYKWSIMSDPIQTSRKKGKLVMDVLKGQYYYDGLYNLMNLKKKVSTFMLKTFETKVTKMLEEGGANPQMLFITDAIVCLHKSGKRIRYHGRSRFALMTREHCKFRLTFAEKPFKEFYKQMLEGRAPTRLSFIIKEKLGKKDAGYEEVKKLQFLLHAKGRQQQRLIFKRRILEKWIELKRMGNTISYKVLKFKLLDEEAQTFEDKYGYLFDVIQNVKDKDLEERMAIYEAKTNGKQLGQ